jgi:hypothetical protein
MRFPYRQYISQYPGSSDFRLILRPVITVRIGGPRASARWDALVDTGADETLLPLSRGELLGVILDRDATSQAAGITGELLTILYGDVEFQIGDGHETARWRTTVRFVDFGSADDEVIVLGHGGCLDYFTAEFDGENADLQLKANSLLPE